MNKQWIREDLRQFTPYHANAEASCIKLDANESFYPLPQSIKQSLSSWLLEDENLNRYPDTDSTELRTAIAHFWQLQPKNVTCGVGSDQLIDSITKLFLAPKEVLLSIAPSFSMYEMCTQLNHGTFCAFPLNSDFSFSGRAFVEEAKRVGAKVALLCSPNNPTGNRLAEEEILYVIQNAPIPVVLDEAYAEFTDSRFATRVQEFCNLIVLRTFSKAYGLAGARVGYALACSELIEGLDIVKPPFNLPTLSQKLATEALLNHALYAERARQTAALRDELVTRLECFPFLQLYPSDSNFIFVRSECDLHLLLKTDGILIRNLGKDRSGYNVRITVGSEQENNALIQSIKKIESDLG